MYDRYGKYLPTLSYCFDSSVPNTDLPVPDEIVDSPLSAGERKKWKKILKANFSDYENKRLDDLISGEELSSKDFEVVKAIIDYAFYDEL